MARRDTSPPDCFEPSLVYALETNFAYFGGTPAGNEVMLLVQLKPTVLLRQLQAIDKNLRLGPTGTPSPSSFITARGPFTIVGRANWIQWAELASSVRLSVPVQPVAAAAQIASLDPQRPQSPAGTVLAVIDDGCAFAHAALQAAVASSRVFAIWDQNTRAPTPVSGGTLFGRAVRDFGYGLEYWRAGSAPDAEIGIDAWIAAHQLPSGSIDEDGCYDEAGFDCLRRRATHGTHILDVMAGAISPASRMSVDRKTPPDFKVSADVGAKLQTDLIFIQLPQWAVDDATGEWLEVQVLHSLQYIMSCVPPAAPTHVIVNLSYGPATGPHDGSHALEQIFASFTGYYDGRPGRPKLDIVLPAGNFHLSDTHVVCRTGNRQSRTFKWTWRVLPDNAVPVFAEFRVPVVHAAAVTLQIRTPDGAIAAPPQVFVEQRIDGADHLWKVFIHPTSDDSAATGQAHSPHGDWVVQVVVKAPNVTLHAYLARTGPNMGSRIAAKPSRFIDARWEARRGGAAAQRYVDGCRVLSGSLVARDGTFNGIATATTPGVHVANGYQVLSQQCSTYASRGPNRGAASRIGPDRTLPTDESPALPGIRAAGNRSGSVFRMVGTSAAAPQLARRIAGPGTPAACPVAGQDPAFGCGRLPPP